jgi:hypothetical protein
MSKKKRLETIAALRQPCRAGVAQSGKAYSIQLSLGCWLIQIVIQKDICDTKLSVSNRAYRLIKTATGSKMRENNVV